MMGDYMKRISSNGQALVEYILIIALVSIVIIGLVKAFSGSLKDTLTKTTCSVNDLEYVKGKKPGEGKCLEIEDLEDIFSDEE